MLMFGKQVTSSFLPNIKRSSFPIFIFPLFLVLSLAACGGGSGEVNTGAGSPPQTSPDTSRPNPEDGESFAYDETARFNTPTHLTIDAVGNLYVMDDGNQAIRKIASNGEVSTLLLTQQSGQIASDPSGNIFLLSYDARDYPLGTDAIEIHKLTTEGDATLVLRSEVGPYTSDPRRIATDNQGNLYVLRRYRTNFTVERIDSAGQAETVYRYSSQIAGIGDLAINDEGDLALAVGIEMESVPNAEDHLIIVPRSLQPAENYLEGVTTRSFEPAGVQGNLVFGKNGDIYIADTAYSDTSITAFRIFKVAADGITTTIYRGFPDGSSAVRPITNSQRGWMNMTRAPNGDFYISDPYLHAIYRITQAGQVSLVAGKPGEAGNAD